MGDEPFHTGLEAWAGVLGDGTISDDAIARVAEAPGFADAMRHSVQGALALYDSNRTMHSAVRDIGRFILGVIALYMDATGGLTHRRLRTLSGDAGVVSAGRATAVLWQLRRIGYVTAQSQDKAGKVLRYVPSPEMRAAFNARFRVEFEAAAKVDPAAAAVLTLFDVPEFHRALFAELGKRALEAVASPFHASFALNEYSQRNCGMVMLFALVTKADPGSGDFPVAGRADLSIASLAARFEVSRTHVRRLLKELERAGYYTPDADGGVLQPQLCDAIRRYYCINYVGLFACGHAALLASAGSAQ